MFLCKRAPTAAHITMSLAAGRPAGRAGPPRAHLDRQVWAGRPGPPSHLGGPSKGL
nr:hypothetical protein HeiferVagina-S102_00072 [Bovine alphaherpesvirus 1]WHT50202.1 hypothetical protein HeiferVagina-S102_00084 [Bovine alphaherpesvirus 1]WHT50277.1 hypothetical protein Milk-S104_00073 [Bovine alphaherpesvirus 1]WHT50289.1 hypothetical protein Milk-S104_00085 [Bovine alphaherpesvirus 1]WHT50368.1 hypothetical protein Docile-S101_00076 [Bovine alphaherpesvirus 1]